MINLKNTTLFKCECGNHTFEPKFVIRKRSALLSETGKEEYVTIQILACSNCGEVPEEYKKILVEDYA